MNGSPGARAIEPLRWPADAELTLPGSKSEANRLLVVAALSGQRVRIVGATPSDDVRHLVAGLATLGFLARFLDEDAGVVEVGPRSLLAPTGGELFCGNAGTALRFLVSVAAITPGEWVLTGDADLQRRPIGPLVAAWQQLGVAITDTDGCPPVRVRGGHRTGGEVSLDASVSSQFVSSLLLVGARLTTELDIRLTGPLASAQYAHLTLATLARCNVQAMAIADQRFVVMPGFGALPAELPVAGDWSGMGIWTCLQFLTGSRLRATNLQRGSQQADEQLGTVLETLRGQGERTIDVAPLPDQFLALAITAALRPGLTRFVGGANLRVKECDRIAVVARELRKCGARVEELPDGLVVHGGALLHGARIDPERDHRVAMAFSLLGCVVPGIVVENPDCIAKSYPTFWRDLDTVLATRRCVTVVGMRGAGKSTFAKALAAATGSPWLDTDDAFVAQHGPIAGFVAENGWPAFRAIEATLVTEALAPGRIVSTGGGAIEDPHTRERLREHSLVVWLDGSVDLLRERIAAGTARPSLTGAPIADEVATVLAHRRPLYEGLATLRLDAATPTAQQVEQALHLLAAPCRFGPHTAV